MFKKKKIRKSGTYAGAPAGYRFTPSFIRSGKRYATIVRIHNGYGNNRHLEFGWFINLIPEINIKGVRGYLITRDKPATKKEQHELISKHAEGKIKGVKNGTSTNPESENDENIRKDAYQLQDLNYAITADSRDELIINANIYVMLTADSPDAIAHQIERLDSSYGDKLLSVSVTSLPGAQQEYFEKLLSAPEKTMFDFTWMSSQYGGNDHAVRKGLNDKKGWAIGEMAVSHASGEAFMDLDGSFDTNIVVAAHENAVVHGFNDDYSAPSMWGQLIANQAVTNGHKVFHIVANDFSYQRNDDKKGFMLSQEIQNLNEYFDMSRISINPLEGMGDIENLVSIYNNRKEIITKMFYLLSDRSLDNASQTTINEALNKFYIDQRMWDRQAPKYPQRSNFLNITRHDSVPTLGTFIKDLTNLVSGAETEKERDRNKEIKATLKKALNSNEEMFNEYTSVPDLKKINKYQFYFDLSQLLEQPNTLEAQFLNIFDYATSSAEKGDIIMLHGLNNISLETLNLIKMKIKFLRKKKIRIAYLFDTIYSKNKASSVETANLFNTESILYEDFEHEFDYSILGTMNDSDVEQYQKKINQTLTESLIDNLRSKVKYQYQIRRPSDLTSDLINADFII